MGKWDRFKGQLSLSRSTKVTGKENNHRNALSVRPCPHDTFPNWARSIAPSSRPVARVHTGATGTLVPDPRDHLATWNEWARSIAIGCALSNPSYGRSSGRYRPVSKSAAVGTRLLDLLLPLLGTCALSRVFNRLRHVKADTRTLISIWEDASIHDGLDNCRRTGEVKSITN